jgi:hypothetical protein
LRSSFRHKGLPALLLVLSLVGAASSAHAAAEVHKLQFVFNAIPGSVDGGDFNRSVDDVNVTLKRAGLQTLDHVSFGWQFGLELRYFVRPNIAVAAGVSHLRARQEREYLPTLTSDVILSGEVLSVPIHLGGDYYFTPYNQGDFRAQFYAGGGILSLTSTRATLQLQSVGLDSTSGANSFRTVSTGDGTGFYTEMGVHMFFAMRYSVILGGVYRSAEVRPTAVFFQSGSNPEQSLGYAPRSLSATGFGVRASISVGL